MKIASILLGLFVLLSLAGPALAPNSAAAQFRDAAGEPPSARFPLGTDDLGRDNWSRLLHAGRWSLLVSVLATSLSLSAGTVLGLSAARGERAEQVLLWLADLTLSLPWLYLLFAVRGLLPLSLAPEAALLAVIGLVGLIGWASPARLVWAAARRALDSDYVRAARAFGGSDLHVWRFHVLPALRPVLAAQIFILLPRYALAESALSFLGLGLGEPTPTWGALLAATRQSMTTGLSWWNLAPALPLMVLTVSCAQAAERKPITG